MVDSMLKPYVCQWKTVPPSKGPSIVDASMSGSHSDQEEMSVCRLQMLSIGASMRISSRVITGAFSSMSMVRILISLLSGFYRLIAVCSVVGLHHIQGQQHLLGTAT